MSTYSLRLLHRFAPRNDLQLYLVRFNSRARIPIAGGGHLLSRRRREQQSQTTLLYYIFHPKKSPEDNQPSPGDWGLGQDDQAFNRTILKARKTQRGMTMKGIDPNSHNSSKTLAAKHIPLLIFAKLKPILTQMTLTLLYNFKKRRGQKNG